MLLLGVFLVSGTILAEAKMLGRAFGGSRSSSLLRSLAEDIGTDGDFRDRSG